MKKMVCSLLLAASVISFAPSAFAEASIEASEPSPWATKAVQEAIELGMVPEWLQGNWQQDLTRSEFADLAICFLAVQYGYGAGTGFDLETFWEDYLTLRSDPNGDPFSKANYLKEQEASPDAFFSWQGILADRMNVFDDVETGSEATYINLAYLLGIVKGQGENLYNPAGTITRQEAATLLARTYGIYGMLEPLNDSTTPFLDSELIASWAKEGVTVMKSWDILHGDENGAFLPNEHYTREQGIATFMRLYQNMPVSRYHGTLAPLLTQADVVERCLSSGPYPTVQYKAETELCTILYLTYGGTMHPPAPAVFLIYPDSTYKRISNTPGDPEDFQLTDQDTKLTFSTAYFGEHYSLDLQTGTLEKV